MMRTSRLEAFSDGVLAIIITIMVLEMKIPHHAESVMGPTVATPSLADLKPVLPVFLSYVLSFVYVGIYWTNHHHMFQVTTRVTGAILWANLHLLFWLSLIPFATAWLGENHFASTPAALYGFILFMAALAYVILQWTILHDPRHGGNPVLAAAIGRDSKGKASAVLYVLGIVLSYFVSQWLGCAMYVLVACIWLIPDRRIERAMEAAPPARKPG